MSKTFTLVGTTIAIKINFGEYTEWLVDTYPRLIESENITDDNFPDHFMKDYEGNGIEEVKVLGSTILRKYIHFQDIVDGVIEDEMEKTFKKWNHTILEY